MRRWRTTARVGTAALAGTVVLAGTGLLMDAAGPGRPARASGAPAQNAVPVGTRAMWLWSRAEPTAVVAWAQREGVREVFAYVTPAVATGEDLPRLRELRQRLAAAGIALSALGGEPDWVHDRTAALAWQRAALGTGLFDRAHVDVEPYALNAWVSDQRGTVQAYLELLDALREADPRPLEVDVPFWYGEIPGLATNLADEVLARVDAVTVMSYRDTATGPNSMAAVGADMLTRGARAGVPVRLGAETQHLPDCLHCSFFEEGQQAMRRVLLDVDTAVAGHATYAGIAVHHYGSWTTLRP